MKTLLTLLFFLNTICFTALAQKRNKSKNDNFIIVTGKVLTPEDSSQVKDLFLTALREKTSIHYELAEDYFKRVLTLDPSNDATMFEMAQLALNNKQLDVAQEYAEQAVTVNPNNTWYWLLNANIYQQQKNYPLLVYALNELLKLNPDKPEYKFDKANALFLINKPAEALAIYTELEKNNGINDELVAAKQRVYLKTGEIDKAAKDLENLIAKQPDHIKYYLLLAQLYYGNDFHDKAIQRLLKAAQIDALNYEVNLALANIYLSDKNENLAYAQIELAFAQKEMPIDQKVAFVISYFNQFPDTLAINRATKLAKMVTKTNPDDPKSFSLYGDVLYQANNLPQAEKIYEKALELNPNVYAIWDQLIRIKMGINNYVGAIMASMQAAELFPNQADLFYYLGVAYSQTKQPEKAITNLKQALELYVGDNDTFKSQIYSSLGDVYQELKNYKESATAYEQSLKLQPKNAYTLNNYAYYLSLRNQSLDLAEKMALQANELEPGNPSFEDTYAWVLFKQKKYADAKLWMDKAMKNLDTNNGIQFEHLGDILYNLGNTKDALLNWQKAVDYGEKNPTLKRKIDEKKYFD
ncbi:MAG: tetratricopeptide repeat protein [Sphingobacteriales bacterium]|nr:MAG: tetratricopeptide repeat protein [Sphingobacteriales bacterium]